MIRKYIFILGVFLVAVFTVSACVSNWVQDGVDFNPGAWSTKTEGFANPLNGYCQSEGIGQSIDCFYNPDTALSRRTVTVFGTAGSGMVVASSNFDVQMDFTLLGSYTRYGTFIVGLKNSTKDDGSEQTFNDISPGGLTAFDDLIYGLVFQNNGGVLAATSGFGCRGDLKYWHTVYPLSVGQLNTILIHYNNSY